MKAVLISIQGYWSELIANGKKTIEVRKTRPKIKTPFKCYIYCTKGKSSLISVQKDGDVDYCGEIYHGKTLFIKVPQILWNKKCENISGKVIGEFVCDRIICCQAYYDDSGEKHLTNLFGVDTSKICLSESEIFDYIIGKDKKDGMGWLWHISELKIYDNPKGVGEFSKPCNWEYDCCTCPRALYDLTSAESKVFYGCDREITRPPQSWMFVEELL